MLSKHLLAVNQRVSTARPHWRVATQSCSGGSHPSELSVLGQDLRPRTERSGWEATPAISVGSQLPRLWIQGFAALFTHPAFVCFSSSSCSIQQPSLTTCPPCVEALAFGGLCSGKQSKARPPRASSYRLISTSCFSSLGQQKKGGRCGPVPMAPCSPTHKGEATKTFSTMAGVGVRFHPECTCRRKAGKAGLHRQRRHVGAGEWAGPLGRRQEAGKAEAKEGEWVCKSQLRVWRGWGTHQS